MNSPTSPCTCCGCTNGWQACDTCGGQRQLLRSPAAPEPWLWPDHVISKRESRALREQHNALVNSHAGNTAKLISVIKRARDELAAIHEHDYPANDCAGSDGSCPTLCLIADLDAIRHRTGIWAGGVRLALVDKRPNTLRCEERANARLFAASPELERQLLRSPAAPEPWLTPRPVGLFDWCLTVCVVVLSVPVLLTFGLLTLALRALNRGE